MTHLEFKKQLSNIDKKIKTIKSKRDLLITEYTHKYIKYPIGTTVMINGIKGWIKEIEFYIDGDYYYIVAGFKINGDRHAVKIIDYFANESELHFIKEE